MATINTHFPATVSSPKLLSPPIKPTPGDTLLKQLATPKIASFIETPVAASNSENKIMDAT